MHNLFRKKSAWSCSLPILNTHPINYSTSWQKVKVDRVCYDNFCSNSKKQKVCLDKKKLSLVESYLERSRETWHREVGERQVCTAVQIDVWIETNSPVFPSR